ncbi:MAG: hypothetical protein J0H04_04165 [Hyphomicrobium denitrificans]|nr:hypothetical protein [Hyphomicrobium denitrificans]
MVVPAERQCRSLERGPERRGACRRADFTGANIYGTVFKDAKGLAEVNGLDHAKYRDKAIF